MTDGYFSIFSQDIPTKENVIVNFKPDEFISKYTYRVYNEDALVDVGTLDSNQETKILLESTGKYKIKVEAYDKQNKMYEINSGIYNIDKEEPKLSVGEAVLKMAVGDGLDVMGNVKAKDNFDGDITSKVTSNIKDIDLTKIGTQKLIYTVSDRANNVTTKSVTLNIQKRSADSLIFVQIVIIICLLALMVRVAKYGRSLRLEKRFGKYSLSLSDDKVLSLADKAKNLYSKMINFLNSKISKSYYLTRYSKRFDKHLIFYRDTFETSMDIVSMKVLLGFTFLLIAIISKAMQYQMLSMYEMCFPILIGFFVPDLLFTIVFKIYRERLENDLLQAIIIMNNAFKSGRSIVQAIDMVGGELKGPISYEFKKMSKEISHGLNIDVVFKRFADRIDIEEVNYLTASLTILNKTGGNIIKVFSSIEHSLFMKKKLRLELNSLAGSSKIIVNILFMVPIGFVVLISLISPGYFNPFFTNQIGIMLLTFMIIYYIIYIVFVRKILKVRM